VNGHVGSSFQDSVLDLSGKDTLTGNCGERNIVLTVTSCNDFDNFARRADKFESARDLRGLGQG
jgi:hypothetical protein